MSECLQFLPTRRGFQGGDHVQALSPGCLDVAFNTEVFQPLAHIPRRADNMAPFQALAGVQIENERIGMFDILDASPPRVYFQHTGLDQIDESAKVMDDDGFFGFAIFLLHVSDFHRVRQPGKGVLLEEAVAAVAVRASNERERPARDVG